MRTKSMLGKVKGLLLGLTMVPAVFVMEYAGPAGIRVAQGCAAGGGGVPLPSPRIIRQGGEPGGKAFPVATDGFFLMETTQPVQDPTTSIEVTVTSAGVEVPGVLQTLEDSEKKNLLGWHADQALPMGALLEVHVEVLSSSASDDVLLSVVGEPTELAAPEISFGEWVDFRRGIGDLVACRNVTGCPTPIFNVYGDEEARQAVEVRWHLPEITGFVAWRQRLELSNGVAAEGAFGQEHVFSSGPRSRDVGIVAFPEPAARQCATLVVEDLRTGQEQRSELCAEPDPPGTMYRNYSLEACERPPSPTLQHAWCESHENDPICLGAADLRPLPEPPDGVPNHDANDGTADDELESGTSEGCQMAPSGSLLGSGATLFFALGVVAARRRRSR
jgi:hypothetical protein